MNKRELIKQLKDKIKDCKSEELKKAIQSKIDKLQLNENEIVTK